MAKNGKIGSSTKPGVPRPQLGGTNGGKPAPVHPVTGVPAGRPAHGKDAGTGYQSPGSSIQGLTKGQQDAFVALRSILQQYNLGALAETLVGYIKKGYSQTTISYLLEQSDAWKTRFAGNEARVKNGLAVLSPADYLATEAAYKQVFQSYGIPSGTYDGQDQLAKWIGSNVSADEIKTRVDAASTMLASKDPTLVTAFKNYYGIDRGHLLAYFLDNTKGEQILQQQAQAAQIGAAGAANGFNVDRNRAELYQSQGVTQAAAQQGFGQAGQVLPGMRELSDAYGHSLGESYGSGDAMDEFLGGLASAARKRQKLASGAQADFAGSGGIGSDQSNSTLSTASSGRY